MRWHLWLFTAVATVLLPHWASGALAATPRIVTFIPEQTAVCPKGWSDYETARGYVIRGTASNELIEKRLGAPIEDRTAPRHSHPYRFFLKFKHEVVQFAAQAEPGGGERRAQHHDIEVAGQTSMETGNLPYVQYRVCQEIEPTRATYFPMDTVLWFAGDRCPDDWVIYQELTEGGGRTILPLPDRSLESGLVVDDGMGAWAHVHSAKVYGFGGSAGDLGTIRTNLAGYTPTRWMLGARGWTVALPVENFDTQRTGSQDRAGVTGGARLFAVPSVYLRPCRKTSNTRFVTKLERGVGLFTTGTRCGDRLKNVASASGRFLIGLPPRRDGAPEPESGVAFGGDPLRSGEIRKHHHKAESDFKISGIPGFGSWGDQHAAIQLADGNMTGTTDEAGMGVPYVQLKFCVVP